MCCCSQFVGLGQSWQNCPPEDEAVTLITPILKHAACARHLVAEAVLSCLAGIGAAGLPWKLDASCPFRWSL